MPSTAAAATTKLGTAALRSSLTRYYGDREHFQVLRHINAPDSAISLRLVEWYVTEAARTSPKYDDEERSMTSEYNDNLRVYTRRMFDPFRRNARILLCCDNDVVETTLGQMNFFRWFIERGAWSRLLASRDAVVETFAKRGRAKGSVRQTTAHSALSPPYPELPRTTVLMFD
jgi:hypothetical protein